MKKPIGKIPTYNYYTTEWDGSWLAPQEESGEYKEERGEYKNGEYIDKNDLMAWLEKAIEQNPELAEAFYMVTVAIK